MKGSLLGFISVLIKSSIKMQRSSFLQFKNGIRNVLGGCFFLCLKFYVEYYCIFSTVLLLVPQILCFRNICVDRTFTVVEYHVFQTKHGG